MGAGAEKTIILVDDSPDDVQLFLRVCTQVGINNPIVTFDGADAALEYLTSSGNPLPGIVVLDLKMPGRDGFYALAQLKAHPLLKQLVVIVLTTSSQTSDIRRAYEMGANSFLTKPLELAEFREMVTAFHDHWLVKARIPLPATMAAPARQTSPTMP